MTDFEPLKCECCKHAMLGGLRNPRVCRDCVAAGRASDPIYCANCNGVGTVGTGIDEAPASICNVCCGTGIAR